jgi:cytosine/adenosine deaminase-related metal-dependent hydrolase
LCEETNVALAEAQALYRDWHGSEGDRIRVSYAPRFAVSCTDQLLREVSRLSREQNALVHIHASENRKELELVRSLTGKSNIDYLDSVGLLSPRSVLAHCVWPESSEISQLASAGAHVAHCPSSNLKLASGIAPVPRLRAAGVNVALGADGAPSNNNLSALGEMKLAALIHKPGSGPRTMRALEVLDMATRDGARALGWWDTIGSLEPGKAADLVALDLSAPENLALRLDDPEALASAIVYSSQPQHVRWTWVAGRNVYQQGRPKLAPLLAAAQRDRIKLRRAAGLLPKRT